MREAAEALTNWMAGKTSPGVLNPVSRTFEVAKPTVGKFIPSGGRVGLSFPDTSRLPRLIGKILSGGIGGPMS
jgi:hypothetical protein